MKSTKFLKNVFIMFIVVFLLLMLNPLKVFAGTGFIVDKMTFDIVVDDTNTYHVKQVIDTTFYEEKHGIYINVLRKGIDGVKETTSEIRNFNSSENYEITTSGNYYKIKLGDADKLITGKKQYILDYDYQLFNKQLVNGDYLFFTFVGDHWEVPVNEVTFKITMPTNISLDQVNIQIDDYHKSRVSETLKYSIQENVVYFSFKDTIDPGQYYHVKINLPEGYFLNQPENPQIEERKTFIESSFSDIKILFFPLLFFLIVLILYIFLHDFKKNNIIKQSSFNLDMTPLEFSIRYYGYLTFNFLNAEILNFAKLGCLEIIEPVQNKQYVIFRKLQEYNGRDSLEKEIFDEIFKNQTEIFSTEVAKQFKFKYVKWHKRVCKKYGLLNDNFIKKIVFFLSVILVMWGNYSLIDINVGESFLGQIFTLFFISLFDFGLISSGCSMNIDSKKDFSNNSFLKMFVLGTTSIVGIIILVSFKSFMMPGLGSISLLSLVCNILTTVLLFIVNFIISGLKIRRFSNVEIEKNESVLAFGNYLKNLSRRDFENFAMLDNGYLFEILPYIYVLEKENVVSSYCENIYFNTPMWYKNFDSARSIKLSNVALTYSLLNLRNEISSANSSVSYSDGYWSHHSAGGGFSGGGGSSGGGSGGGGSW